MDEKSPAMGQTVTFAKPNIFPMAWWYMPSLFMAILLVTVGFFVLTPLGLMILNSFQIARPGEPIVWGLDGWVKAFTTPGILKAMGNTVTLAVARQAIALVVGCFFAWLIARTDMPWRGPLEFLFWLSFFLPP